MPLFISDRNLDMDADSEKWNSDGGFSKDAEEAVRQSFDLYDSGDKKRVRRDKGVDVNYQRAPGTRKQTRHIAEQINRTLVRYLNEARNSCSKPGKLQYGRLAAASAFVRRHLAVIQPPRLSKEQLQRLCSVSENNSRGNKK
jgi:hypothetical protein